MTPEKVLLQGDSAGTQRALQVFHYGDGAGGPKVYLQAGLHTDEMPGILVLQHLMRLLDRADAEGRIKGRVTVVPAANPIGLSQWLMHKPLGRKDAESLQNFNRHYPDLAGLAGDGLEAQLCQSERENRAAIRRAFGEAIAEQTAKSELEALRLALLRLSHDADYVLDLHCDHRAILHLYTTPARAQDTELLARSIGAELVLVQDVSGGNAFDEANSAPWAALRARFGAKFPIPFGCFAATLEYRGQLDVDDTTAAADAANLMQFLTAIGAVSGPQAAPAYPAPPCYPLGGALEAFAPQGGVVTWATRPGDRLAAGGTLAHVTDPMTRQRLPVPAPCEGIVFRQELWPSCLRGQGLTHVAGPNVLREGHLLSD